MDQDQKGPTEAEALVEKELLPFVKVTNMREYAVAYVHGAALFEAWARCEKGALLKLRQAALQIVLQCDKLIGG